MDHHAPVPPSDPTTPPLTFLHSPLAIAILVWASSLGAGYLRDRLSMETRDTSSATRIDAMSARVDRLENTQLPEAQFHDFQQSTDKRLDGIQTDLRDLKKLLLQRP